MAKTLQENLTRQLSESVARLQEQAEKVEFWASAVTGLVQPVPDYEPDNTAVQRYLKPGHRPRKRKRRASRKTGEPSSADGPKPASA